MSIGSPWFVRRSIHVYMRIGRTDRATFKVLCRFRPRTAVGRDREIARRGFTLVNTSSEKKYQPRPP